MAKRESLQTEREHQQKAFEIYYALGAKRTYKEVARQMEVSPSTIKLWSNSFSWRKRIGERDAEVARRVADRTLETNADLLARDQKIVHMALIKLAKGIANGTVKMQLGDLDRLVRLRGYLDETKEEHSLDRICDALVGFMGTLGDDFEEAFAEKLRAASRRQRGE